MTIYVQCYLSALELYQEEYPAAHFEVITRAHHEHPLSPSWALLNEVRERRLPFPEYHRRFVKEVVGNPMAIAALERLRAVARHQDLFLVCYEKDPKQCHRSIVRAMLVREIKFAKPFHKLEAPQFSTIRRFDLGFIPGEPWTVIRHDGKKRVAMVVDQVLHKQLREIPDEFLMHDTGTSSRGEAITTLETFYPGLAENEELTIVRLRWE